MKYLLANPGRSGHKLSLTAQEFVFKTRLELKKMFSCPNTSRVILTKNCTEALNFAILGTKKQGEIITTIYEHNSVIRPLKYLEKQGISVHYATPTDKKITRQDIEKYVNEKTYLIILNGISNVTGEINDIEGIGKLCKENNITFMLDGAQASGHIEIDMIKQNINILCVSGHKGLNGIMGSGALMFDDKTTIYPITFGGTGTDTFSDEPYSYPEKLECGTVNLPSICSLYEGVIYAQRNLSFFGETLINLSQYLIDKISPLPIKIYSKANPCGIVAISSEKYDSITLSELLSEKYDIATRGGFQCAPLVHKWLNTQENGLLRLSLCPQNTKLEINKVYYALKELLTDI